MAVPTIEPAAVTAGDTVTWSRSLADYPASSGWTLAYALRNAAEQIDITATASGADHLVSVPAATSRAWKPGVYGWGAYVTNGADRFEVARGSIVVRPNLQQATPLDSRSHARKVLDAIEAVIEGRASRDQEEYTIGDRSLKRTPITELLRLRSIYRAEVAREDAAADLVAGRPARNRFYVRLGSPR